MDITDLSLDNGKIKVRWIWEDEKYYEYRYLLTTVVVYIGEDAIGLIADKEKGMEAYDIILKLLTMHNVSNKNKKKIYLFLEKKHKIYKESDLFDLPIISNLKKNEALHLVDINMYIRLLEDYIEVIMPIEENNIMPESKKYILLNLEVLKVPDMNYCGILHTIKVEKDILSNLISILKSYNIHILNIQLIIRQVISRYDGLLRSFNR